MRSPDAYRTLPATDVFTVKVKTSTQAITDFRLELPEDTALPLCGPGRQPDNGKIVLTEYAVSVTPVVSVPEPAAWLTMTAGLELLGLRVGRRQGRR